MADPTDLVARVGFSVPKLDGKGERRFEAGHKIPAGVLTDKTRESLLRQGVIAGTDDENPPEVPWRQTTAHVNGELQEASS